MKKIFSYGVAKAGARGLNWSLMMLLPLFLADAEYGVVGLIVGFEGLVVSALLFGQDRAVLRFYHGAEERGRLLYTSMMLWLALAVPVLCLLAGAAMGRGGDVLGIPLYPHFLLLCVGVFLLGLFRVLTSVLRVEQDAAGYARYMLALYGGKCAVVVGLAYLTGSSAAYVVGLLLVGSLVAGRGLRSLWRRVDAVFDRERAWKLWRFGWPFVFHIISGGFLTYVDRFMLEYFRGTAAVGVYSLAYAIGAAVSFVYAALATYFEPHIYRQAGDVEAGERWLGIYTVACLILAAVLSAVLIAVLPFVVRGVYDESYYAAIGLVPVVLAGYLVQPLYRQANYRLTLYEKTRSLALGTVTGAMLNVVLNFFLIPVYGMRGAAVATALSFLIFGSGMLLVSLWQGQVALADLRGRPVLALAVIVALIVTFAQNVLPVYLALGGLAAAAALYLWRTEPFFTDLLLQKNAS